MHDRIFDGRTPLIALALLCAGSAAADGAFHDLSSGNFAQDWTTTDAALAINDDWSGVPSIIGYLGDVDAGTPTGVDPRTRTQESSGAVDLIANLGSNVASTTGGVAEFQALADPVVALQGSGTADAPSLVLHLNATGRTNVTLSYNLRDIDTTADNSVQSFALQYRLGSVGLFTSLDPGGFVVDASDGPSLVKTTPVSVDLSAATGNAIDNQAQLELRILTTNAVSGDEWVGIDDLLVTSTASVVVTPELSIAPAPARAEGDSGAVCSDGSNKLVFPVTATPAPTSTLAFTATVSGGTATAAVDIGTLATVAVDTSGNGAVEVPVNCDLKIEPNETVEVTLQAGADYTLGTTMASGTINNDDSGDLLVGDVAQFEGTGANSTFTFNVSLAGGVLAGAGGVSVDFTVVAGGATPATIGTDFTGASGTLTIAEDANSAGINVTVIADSDDEPDETFVVDLANPVGATLGDNQALATIRNDDSLIPQISIDDVGVTEGDSGSQNAVFTVSLVPAPAGTVTVDYATADGLTDPATAGADYLAASGILSFDAANSSRQISVVINGDTTDEADETYLVNLSNIVGTAAFANGDAQGLGTITDNDFTTTLSVPATLSVAEGNAGAANASILISADVVPEGGSASVDYATAGVSASDGSDFTGVAGTATITCAAGPALPCNAAVDVSILGDLLNEADETLTLTLSNPVGTNVVLGNPQTTLTIANDDTASLTIEEIQGNGIASPFATQTVTTLGNIVTAVLPAPNGGFMMQMPDAAASPDPASSNGVFVFTGGTPSVQLGDQVDVRGTVVEFGTGSATAVQRVTEFTNSGLIFNIVSSGNALPTPIALDANLPSPDAGTPSCGPGLGNFECFESMRVTTSTGMINLGNQTFGTDPVAEMWITTTGVRAFRDGGLTAVQATESVPVLDPPAPPLPTTFIYDQNPEVFEIDMDRAGLPNTTLVPGSTFSATGVLSQEFGTFELFPTEFAAIALAPDLPTPVQDARSTELTIASQNLHLLFDDVNDPWNAADCAGGDVNFCPDTTRWNAKLNLLSRQIRENLRNPMVVGVQEVEKQGALQALADKINTDLAGAFNYSAHVGTIDGLDGGHQNVGFLIRNDVTVQSLEQFNTTQTWVFNTVDQGEVMDRPPYLLRASVARSGGPFDFAVLVAHQRSLSGIEVVTPLSAQVNAHRVRQKRMFQAALTAQAVQQIRGDNPTLPFYLIGDLNAFADSDGYADVTGIIRGDTDPAESEYDLSFFGLEGTGANGNIVDPPLTAASSLVPVAEHYSFQFQARPQQIDHAFMSEAGLGRFVDMVFARGNVDQQARFLISFSNSLGTETPLVSSDHDGFVLFIDASTDPVFADGFE